MKKVIIFGAGPTGMRVYDFYKDICEIVAFTDNNEQLWGKSLEEINIIPPENICGIEYDYVVISSIPGYDSICEQLKRMGVPDANIRKKMPGAGYDRTKIFQQYAKEFTNIDGACAELGVFQGTTAAIINEAFPNRKLYLFDTFSGFDDRDVEVEQGQGFSDAKEGEYKDTSVEQVLKKMKYPQNCVIRKGYFPETAEGLEEVFAFVRMDVDLYKPTRDGLEWFGNRMSRGAWIILHDYYTESYSGVRKAVDEYVAEHSNICRIAAGDGLSVILHGF